MSPVQALRGIVVGVDGSTSSTVAVEWAARSAAMRRVPLNLVHVVPPMGIASTIGAKDTALASYAQFHEERSRTILAQAHETAITVTSTGMAPPSAHTVTQAAIVPTLVALSEQADMIVVGRRGLGAVTGTLLGSVSSGLIHHAHCPVAIVHDEDPLVMRSPHAAVVVGIDGSPTSELATAIAFQEAACRKVELVALHAWTDMGALEFARVNWAPIEWRNIEDSEKVVLAERLSGWRERYPDVVVRKLVVCDRPAFRLLEQAADAQLIVVGSHGRGGFPGMLLGSVSAAVVNAAPIPVIVARTRPRQ
ncbi:universal stress protein [Mycolicibacter sinensis]